MNILIITTKYPDPNESEWLISELANELSSRDNYVRVLNIEWFNNKPIKHTSRNPYISSRPAINLDRFKLNTAIKWVFSSYKLTPYLIKDLLSNKKYDLLITTSPCTATAPAILIAQLISKKSLLIYWDFFPIHNQQILNKIPSKLMPTLKILENILVNTFSHVGCMSPANIDFFNNYFGSNTSQKRFILPLWTSYLKINQYKLPAHISKKIGYNKNEILIVFGGQLVEGRGIDTLLEAIKLVRTKNNKIKLILCGDGPLRDKVYDFANTNPSTCVFLGKLDRENYLNLLTYCDIGIVATVEGVSSPTYPSKSLDYMAAKVPIIASVESASDFGHIIESNRFGLSCPAGDSEALSDAIYDLAVDSNYRVEMGLNGYNYLNNFHSVTNIVDKIIEI